MPSLGGSGPLGAWQFLALALLIVGVVAASTFMVRKHRASDGALPDAVFWDGFAGLTVVLPAVVLPALASPRAGSVLAGLAVATAVLSYRWAPALFRWQENRQAVREATADDDAAALRHRAALARWQRYELDPALEIDFPAMTDPGCAETAAMYKAMRKADQLRGGTGHSRTGYGGTGHNGTGGDGTPSTGYSTAVERFEQALAEAETAAGARHISTGGA